MAKQKRATAPKRTLDARPDTLDFRDKMFEATLVEVPIRVPLASFQKWKVPILDQGTEGACTGFGLATVANFLLRRRRVVPDKTPVSPRMLYEMAKRYDEWPGDKYDGSSARGAMKGWHRHGVCTSTEWPYDSITVDRKLTDRRASDAATRPLGAYFRVNHRDLVAMHAALAEVGILYATAVVHDGWDRVGRNGLIAPDGRPLGGHAFAIAAYDESGFWIQNSWGEDWGRGGFARITYDDWLANATDVWVARLAVPVVLKTARATATSQSTAADKYSAYSYQDIRPHIISIGNHGRLRAAGSYGTSQADVQEIFRSDIERVMQDCGANRLLLYAHGGLVDETSSVQRVADYRSPLLTAGVYPLSFIWKSDFWTTLINVLRDALAKRRPEGILGSGKDFMLDRLDDALEPLTRALGGKVLWDEMKENAIAATTEADGGARIALGELSQLLQRNPGIEVDFVAHSAGAIFHAPLVQLLTTQGAIGEGPLKGERGLGIKVASVTLWAPACTMELFKQCYMPAIESGAIERFCVFTLTDRAEKDDDCGRIYNKSLLYLVSNAFEETPRIPLFRDGVPLLGMERFLASDADFQRLLNSGKVEWVGTPNNQTAGIGTFATARRHVEFDDDSPTLRSTLIRVLGEKKTSAEFSLHRTSAALRARRRDLDPLVQVA